MTQHSIFGRITQLVRANINALLDQAEDPQKLLDQMVRDYTSAISDAEGAVAQTIGNLRMISDDAHEAQTAAVQWGAKADEMRTAGSPTEADKFDNLARIALRKQLDGEADVKNLAVTIADQSATVDKLKDGLQRMRGKLDELRRKRDELVSRSKAVSAQNKVRDAVGSLDILDPTSEVGRFEQKVRREEARIRGHEELAASTLDAQFESLDKAAADAEVEARLSALKHASHAMPINSSRG